MEALVDGVETIDLDALSTDDLLRERGEVTATISRISTQLQTQEGRPETPEDESEAWLAFRDWRRRARWALHHHRDELVKIKQILRERQDVAVAGRRLLRRAQNPTAPSEILSDERIARLNAVIGSATEDELLLRAYRVIRRLLDSWESAFAESLEDFDRETVRAIGIRLRQEYGTGRLKAYADGVWDGAS